MARITIRNGSEGPRHDPYHFEEITFLKSDGTLIVGHFGLVEWVNILRSFDAAVPVEKVEGQGMDDKRPEEAGDWPNRFQGSQGLRAGSLDVPEVWLPSHPE